MAVKLKEYFKLAKDAGSEFYDDEGFKLSASLAYYTIFSVGPFLLVVITIMGFFYERAAVTGKVFRHLGTFVGSTGSKQMQDMLDNITAQSNAKTFGIVGAAILLFGVTGVFTEIQTSINYIWSIKAKPKKGWLKYLTDRLLSFSLVIGLGFLMLVSLLVDLILDVLFENLQSIFGNDVTWIMKLANVALLFVIVTFFFAVIFKVLPDAKVAWKDALVGAACTSVFFLGGKFLISYYIGASVTTEAYGAAASIIILLSWVYYSAIILYYGAEFTQVYSRKFGKGISIYDTAVFIEKRETRELPQHEDPQDKSKRA